MKVHYQLFHAAGRTEKFTAEFKRKGDAGRLADTRMVFARHLPGCEMEHVNVWVKDHYADMFVDEVGKLKGLPVNEKATMIYWANMATHEPDKFEALMRTGTMDMIVGDAILFEEKVWS